MESIRWIPCDHNTILSHATATIVFDMDGKRFTITSVAGHPVRVLLADTKTENTVGEITISNMGSVILQDAPVLPLTPIIPDFWAQKTIAIIGINGYFTGNICDLTPSNTNQNDQTPSNNDQNNELMDYALLLQSQKVSVDGCSDEDELVDESGDIGLLNSYSPMHLLPYPSPNGSTDGDITNVPQSLPSKMLADSGSMDLISGLMDLDKQSQEKSVENKRDNVIVEPLKGDLGQSACSQVRAIDSFV